MPPKGDLIQVATWNAGGGGPDKMLTLLDSFAKIPGLNGIRLWFLQELSLPEGDTKVSSAQRQLLGHRQHEEWRGVGIAYNTTTFTHTEPQHRANVYSCSLHTGGTSFTGISLHVPHHATVDQTNELLSDSLYRIQSGAKMIVGMDANEEFQERTVGTVAQTARGEAILFAIADVEGKFPPQSMTEPSHFPYNKALRSRRLDYLVTKGIFLDEIHVGDWRDIVGSDHEPIVGKARMAATRRQRGKCTCPPGEVRRQLWKQVCSDRKREHREWVRDLAKRAGGQDWGAYRALKRSSKPSQWDNYLREREQWREEAQKHFKDIFAKIDQNTEEGQWGDEVEKLRQRCKRTPWVPFTEMELRITMQSWQWGKATGIDGIAHEALLYLLEHPAGKARLMEIFNDALYTGKLPPDMLKGLTVLLPKTMMPQSWGDTRPITLSSALLKWLAQLLLHRGRRYLDAGNKHQWAKPGSQAVELVLGIRRLLRAAKDWGDALYIVKLDVAKAFDSISQLHMGKLIARRVGGDGGLPWEALLWLQLLRADHLTLAGGASYLDDTYLWSHNRKWLEKALAVLEDKLKKKNLVLNAKKTQAIANVEDRKPLDIGGKQVPIQKGDAIMTILGSPVTFDNVPAVILGGASERARKAFHANKAVMCGNTSVDEKLKAMLALVRPAALWACSTWPVNDALLRGINTVQLQLLRKALGGRRRPGEEWVEWNQRTLRLARLHLRRKSAGGRWSTFVLGTIWQLHGHAARRESPLKEILIWRNMNWWRQQQNLRGGARHARRFCPALDVERHIDDWVAAAQDRSHWKSLEFLFVQAHDPPWASGKQPSLANLAPTPGRGRHDMLRGGGRASQNMPP
ncbi:pol [Symbiodinium microadriaticum]|nr:pol [Symbiodinium microadriaticum]